MVINPVLKPVSAEEFIESRIPFADADGLLIDSPDLTFNDETDILTVGGITLTNSPIAEIYSEEYIAIRPSGADDDYLRFSSSGGGQTIAAILNGGPSYSSLMFLTTHVHFFGGEIRVGGVTYSTLTDVGLYNPNSALILDSGYAVNIRPSGDNDDYISFTTTGDVPRMTAVGGCNLEIRAEGGTIDFDDENLTTTGLGTFGNLDVDTLNLNGNAITDSTGTISFDDENLTTTGDITCDELLVTNPTGAGYKFTGRNNNFVIQNTASGATASCEIFANDGDATDSVEFSIFGKGTPSDVTNCHFMRFGWYKNISKYWLITSSAGAGGDTDLYIAPSNDNIISSQNGDIKIGDDGSTNYVKITSSGDMSFVGTASFTPPYVSQSNEPSVGYGEMVIWHDTDDGKVYLVHYFVGVGQKKVELT